MGPERKQSPCEVLLSNARRAEGTGERGSELEPAFRSHHERFKAHGGVSAMPEARASEISPVGEALRRTWPWVHRQKPSERGRSDNLQSPYFRNGILRMPPTPRPLLQIETCSIGGSFPKWTRFLPWNIRMQSQVPKRSRNKRCCLSGFARPMRRRPQCKLQPFALASDRPERDTGSRRSYRGLSSPALEAIPHCLVHSIDRYWLHVFPMQDSFQPADMDGGRPHDHRAVRLNDKVNLISRLNLQMVPHFLRYRRLALAGNCRGRHHCLLFVVINPYFRVRHVPGFSKLPCTGG